MLGPSRKADRELVDRFLAGDREAFTCLYRSHHQAVFRFVLHMTGDTACAAEITQDAFVWLMHHARDYDDSRAGLATLLVGVARKFLCRREQLEKRWIPLDEETISIGAAVVAPDEAWSRLSRQQDAAELRRAIASLPPRYREVVVLCDLEGQTYAEAAGVIGCVSGTVRSRLHRARVLLARKLARGKKSLKEKEQGCSV